MAERINVSLPENLAEDLKNFKGELPDTISGLCQKVLGDSIMEIKNKKARQEKLKDTPEIIQLIEKLKGERIELYNDVRAVGKKDGFDWINQTSFIELSTSIKTIMANHKRNSIEIYNIGDPVVFNRFFMNFLDKEEIDQIYNKAEDALYYQGVRIPGQDLELCALSMFIPHRLGKELESVKPAIDLSTNIPKIYIQAFINSVVEIWEVIKPHLDGN